MKNFTFEIDQNSELIIIYSLLTRNTVKFEINKQKQRIIDFIKSLMGVIPDIKYELSGNYLILKPAPLLGGKKTVVTEDVPNLLKYISVIAPFMRDNLVVDFTGITNGSQSVDMLKTPLMKIYNLFKLKGISISITKRGFAPKGLGKIHARFDSVKRIEACAIREAEPLDKIRGLVVTSRIGSDISTRMINVIKKEMSTLCETKVYCAVSNKNDSGPSPGYECSVYSESYKGIFYHTISDKKNPEAMAKECCTELLKSIDAGGLIDRKLYFIVFTFMALGHGVSHLRIGELEEDDKSILELLVQFFNIEYSVKKDEDEFVLSVIGCDYVNSFKPL